MTSHPALCEAIANLIANTPEKRITFAQYMDMALYHPEYGYYSTAAVNIGKKGDFFTSPHLGADFGEMLAIQFVQMWEILGKPVPFYLVEMGAGQGYLALDILKYLQQQHLDFFTALEYMIVEKSSILREEQQQKLSEFKVCWCNLAEISSNSIIGCFFSNELVDAFPVHQFSVVEGQLQEIYVTTTQDLKNQFIEVVDTPSTSLLYEYLDFLGVDLSKYSEGYRSEINLAALDWLSVVARSLQRGYLLTIDYGYSGNRYYNPRRSQGTLQCYYHHQRHNDAYINIGQQDITSHVDFTALERWGEKYGLNPVGITQQGVFLMALGLGSRISGLSHQKQPISELLQRRDALHQLIDPMGLGNFCVLAQSKGLKEEEISQLLQGFATP